VASNLPGGDAANGEQGKSNSTESRERINFEVSETQREVLKSPGALRRISVAVLVDGSQVTAADGTTTWQPRSEEELAVLRELVTVAAGLDEARGDALVLKSLEFEPAADVGSVAEAGMMSMFGPLDLLSIIQVAVLAVVALVLGLFVVRPLLTATAKQTDGAIGADRALALPAGEASGATRQANAPRVLTGEIDDQDLPDLPVISNDSEATEKSSDPMDRLRRLIDERQTETVEILRGWMETEEEEQA
jgi:flagellar M-ring protein FliF